MRYAAMAFMPVVLATPASGAEFLTSVTSEVYQAPGPARELARRAQQCIAQHLAAGTVDAPVILTSDLEAGTVVARNAMEYGSFPRWKIRSTFTFEAKESRFRITQTNLERFNDAAFGGAGWYGIGKWWGSDWKKAEKVFAESATAVANCVMAADKKEDW
jgi:hypothetical protein